MFKIAKLILAAGLLTGATAASAGDLPTEVADGVINACRADYHRVCRDVVPGGERTVLCLLDHETELAPSCLKAVKIAHAIEVCTPDYRRYCEGVNGAKAMECLAGRMAVLRPDCGRIVRANAPYLHRHDGRFAYGMNPAPYGEPYPSPYAYRGRPYDDERYGQEAGPGGSAGAYPFPGRPSGPGDQYAQDGRYAQEEGPEGPDGNSPYAGAQRPGYPEGGDSRFRSYDDRYAGPPGTGGSYYENGPGARPLPDEDR